MKEKSSKQSKKDKPAVKIKDLKPTKDAQGGALSAEEMTTMQQDLRAERPSRDHAIGPNQGAEPNTWPNNKEFIA